MKKKTQQKKTDCYECKWREDVSGSAHSRCNHPKSQLEHPLLELNSIMSGGHAPQLKTSLKVKGNEHGKKSGWFNHPLNFDPVWLEECDGFEPIIKSD